MRLGAADITVDRDPEGCASHDRTSPERGVQCALVRNALDNVQSSAGLLVCSLSCALEALDHGTLSLPFPPRESLVAENPYRIQIRSEARARAQVMRFADWLAAEAARRRL